MVQEDCSVACHSGVVSLPDGPLKSQVKRRKVRDAITGKSDRVIPVICRYAAAAEEGQEEDEEAGTLLNSKCGADCMGKCFQNFGAALVPGNKADVEVYCKSRCVYMCDVVEDKSSPATKLIQTADPLNALSGRKRFASAQLPPFRAFAPGSGSCLKASR